MHYAPITSILCTRTALARRDGHIFVSGMKLKIDYIHLIKSNEQVLLENNCQILPGNSHTFCEIMCVHLSSTYFLIYPSRRFCSNFHRFLQKIIFFIYQA